jgi:uncharacterized protein
MKPSKYNICLPYEDKYVIFNGVTKRFFFVSNRNKESFVQILSSPDDYIEDYAPFLKRMADEGFIVEDSVDELEVIKQQYESMNNSDYYHLMILPTYACNVSCWYCTQHHRNVHLSDADIEKIQKHIAYYLTEHQLKGLHLSWFGGEPLLDFHQIIEISVFAQQFCKEHDLFFYNTITTNGILLSREYLEKMKELNFTFFQITIDGTQEEHDKVKMLKGRSAYETTLRNICLIAEILPAAEILMRYNYTTNNLNPNAFIKGLCCLLQENVRKRIHLSLMKVWQENEQNIDNDKLEALVSLATNKQFHVSVGQNYSPCYVDNHNYNTIFPNGKVGKCDNLDPEQAQGRILDTGEILWEKAIPFEHFSVFDDKETECLSCLYLPICYGPCPKERDEVFHRGTHLVCRFQNSDRQWRQNIICYCRRFITICLLAFLTIDSFAQDNDSIYKNVKITEVVIKGKNVVRYPNKDVWFITDSLRQNTYSVKDLIKKLPKFQYSYVNDKLSYLGSDNILFLIDGKRKRGDYIAELANMRFEKIEVMEHPTGKYEDYLVVVNMITKENWKGYDARFANSEDIRPSSPYDKVITSSKTSGTYTYTLPKYDIALHYNYDHSNSHGKYEYHEKAIAYDEQNIDDDNPTNISFSNRHNFWIDADYLLSKNHSISFKYNLWKNVSQTYSNKTMERLFHNEEKNMIIGEESKRHDKSTEHIGTISYLGKLKSWELSSELTYEKLIAYQSNSYAENEHVLFSTPYDNTKNYIFWDVNATKRTTQKTSINIGYAIIRRNYQSQSENHISETKGVRHSLYAFSSMSLNDKLRANIGGQFKIINEDDGTINDKQNILALRASLDYWSTNKFNFNLSYYNQTGFPTQRQLNTNGRWLNSRVFQVGNPHLKSASQHTVSCVISSPHITLWSLFEYSGNAISQVYQNQGTQTILTYDNISSWNNTNTLYLQHTLNALHGTIELKGLLKFHAYSTKIIGTTKNGNNWAGNAEVAYSKPKYPAICICYSKAAYNRLTAQGWSTQDRDRCSLSLNQTTLKGKLRWSISYFIPISIGIKKLKEEVIETPDYEYYSSVNSYEQDRNMIMLSLTYRFAKGKKIRGRNTIQSIQN